MSKIRVAVLRGGPSSEYDVSLKTGSSILKHLPEKYEPVDILISKSGAWHREGLEKSPDRALKHIDVVFNALHGQYGEDGKVQKILDQYAIPYTGSGAMASAVGMNKALSKKAFEHHGIRTPYYTVVRDTDVFAEVYQKVFHHFLLPFIVKPATAGSSVGVTIVKSYDHLKDALASAFSHSDTALIEEFIKGREATCGVIDGFRNEPIYALLPIEIISPKENEFFDYNAKYENNRTQEISPGNFSLEEKAEIQRLAKHIHQALDLRHYSRSDFIVSPRRGIYVLEVNTLPGLTPASLVPKALDAVGCSYADFLDHVLTLALEGK